MSSITRKPRASISFAGTDLPCLDVSVTQTKKAKAGTFSAAIPLADMEAAGCGLDYLATAEQVNVTITFTIGGEDTVMFVGELFSASVQLESRGQVVSLSGRDAAAKLARTKVKKKYVNQTSDEIAQDAAGQAGLSVDTDGNTLIHGKIYTAEQDKIPAGQSNWSLLRQLAESEGKDVCVVKNSLYFHTADDPSLPTYPVFYTPPVPGQPAQSNAISIRLGRNFEVAQGVQVNVQSWDYKKKQIVSSQAQTGSGALVWDYKHHQLTQDRADKQAKGKAKEHARHEFDVTIDMPGDVSLTPFFQIGFSGTGTGFDQSYAIDNLVHRLSASGYRMTVSTKTGKSPS